MVISSSRYNGLLRATHAMRNVVELRPMQTITLSIAKRPESPSSCIIDSNLNSGEVSNAIV
jgi:hypothetical protein